MGITPVLAMSFTLPRCIPGHRVGVGQLRLGDSIPSMQLHAVLLCTHTYTWTASSDIPRDRPAGDGAAGTRLGGSSEVFFKQ